MQTEPQNSLPLTPRLPIEGEPSGCKQEVVESIVTAGRMNQTVKTAEPTITDINRKAMLGREPAGMVHRVDKGSEEHESQSRLQQTEFYCKEDQCNTNANRDVPVANGLPLKGEWTAYPSGKTTDLKGVELEGHKGGTDELTELLMMSVELYVKDSSDIPRRHEDVDGQCK